MRPKKQQAPVKKTAAQQERRNKLRSIHAKRESLDAINSEKGVFYNHPSRAKRNLSPVQKPEQKNDDDNALVGVNKNRRKSFIKIDDEDYGVYFQNVDTRDTVWELPEDGDVVAEDNDDVQHDSVKKRKSFRKIEEDGESFFENVETKDRVWEIPVDGELEL